MKAKEHLNVVLQARISGIEAMQAEAAQLLAQFTQDSPLQQAEYALNHAASYSIDQISAEIRNIDSLLHMPEVKALFFKLFLLNAQKGDAASQSQVGDWYLRGIYTEKIWKKRLIGFKKQQIRKIIMRNIKWAIYMKMACTLIKTWCWRKNGMNALCASLPKACGRNMWLGSLILNI